MIIINTWLAKGSLKRWFLCKTTHLNARAPTNSGKWIPSAKSRHGGKVPGGIGGGAESWPGILSELLELRLHIASVHHINRI